MKYDILAKVDQVVTKEIKLSVTARNEDEAEEKAREALQVYPDPCFVDGVNRILTTKSHYWIPRSIEFVKKQEGKDVA